MQHGICGLDLFVFLWQRTIDKKKGGRPRPAKSRVARVLPQLQRFVWSNGVDLLPSPPLVGANKQQGLRVASSVVAISILLSCLPQDLIVLRHSTSSIVLSRPNSLVRCLGLSRS